MSKWIKLSEGILLNLDHVAILDSGANKFKEGTYIIRFYADDMTLLGDILCENEKIYNAKMVNLRNMLLIG